MGTRAGTGGPCPLTLNERTVCLAGGIRLSCDVPVVATGARPLPEGTAGPEGGAQWDRVPGVPGASLRVER
ncbi:hypothetical protein GCM10023084_36780 [Streptomyces lacrimifluminis]|uniref:Uncharacterized protein n=1 Tax=Streptomyces lacrimifluminis TaxID=1500077 RepID=A0A917L0N5_9ACTN|nr:hypothetical protein GCM10012282_37170 [Streptomyces lacrimifluminis]